MIKIIYKFNIFTSLIMYRDIVLILYITHTHTHTHTQNIYNKYYKIMLK